MLLFTCSLRILRWTCEFVSWDNRRNPSSIFRFISCRTNADPRRFPLPSAPPHHSRRPRILPAQTQRISHLSVYLSICLSIDLSMNRSIYLSTYPSNYRSIYLSINLPTYLSTYLPTSLEDVSAYLPIYLSIYLPAYRSTYLSIHLPT